MARSIKGVKEISVRDLMLGEFRSKLKMMNFLKSFSGTPRVSSTNFSSSV